MERAAIRTVMVVMLAGVGLAPRRSHAETNSTASAAGAPDDHVEPGAATWRTLVLGSGGQLRLPPPPGARETNKEIAELRSLATQRDAAALERIVFWDAGPPSYRWNQIAMARALEVGGPAGFRIMAFVNAAIYDATVAAWDSKLAHRRPRPSRVARALTTVVPNPRSFAYPCEHAVTAGAASAVLAYLDPDNAQRYLALADEAARSRLLAGVASASDARAGLDLGRQVAARVIERARSDGADAAFTGPLPEPPCKWQGTNPVAPLAATWKTWALSSGRQFRPGPPPACGSPKMNAELAEVKNMARTFATNRAAFVWTPASFKIWNDVLEPKLFEYRMDVNPPRAARAYMLLHTAAYDAIVACWDAKYSYWSIRPSQLDPRITTLFPDPNFPSYPSGHATIAGAASVTLGYLFPRDADAFTRQAEEIASSRLWAGVHFRTDNDVGLALGRSVGHVVVELARRDGSR